MTEGIQISGLGLVRMGIKLETGAGHATWVPKDETGGMIVSEPDPIKRLVKSVEAFNKLEAGE
ncbi:MAG: hypothetical protein JWM53_4544 [bacterium]|nr:hypothetical protein [bacterium]